MKKIISIALALTICFMISGCNYEQANSTVNHSKAETVIEFIKLPSPPKYKLIKSKKDIAKINQYIEDYEKTEIEHSDINGWSIILKYSNGKKISIVGDNLIINDDYYRVDNDFESGLTEIYNSLDYKELDYK